MKKRWLALLLAAVLLCGALFWAGSAYFDFVSRTIFDESIAHLTEIFHQANQALYNLVSVNWSRMRMWAPYLETAKSEADIVAYVNRAREECNFTDFFFISRNGNYITLEGGRGYLDLQKQLPSLILERQSVVANSVVPDQPEIMVFAIPTVPGTYRDFAYEAIAVSYNNADLVEALKISAFDGQASTFAVVPDGRIVVDNSSENLRDTFNIFAFLKDFGSLSPEELAVLRQNFREGRSGALAVEIEDTSFYLVYESANFQDWTVVGMVPTAVVNASMSKLQTTTLTVLSGIFVGLAMLVLLIVVQQNRLKLRRKDNELLARDELFSTLSTNVDDVFLMLDADTLRVDYASPNIRKLLGITGEAVARDVHVIEGLVARDDPTRVLEALTDILPGEQLEWDREYIHQDTGALRWFHVIAFCSEIRGEKKYILDLSDRTKERRINQALEEAAVAAESANQAKTIFLNNMSHDIRTPMNAIIGFANIALKQDPKPEVRSCLQKITGSSEHLLTLINDVLDISRIESGKIKFAPIPVDITTVSDTVLSILQGFLSDRNIRLVANLAKPATPYVLADAVRIREVLVNILGNAVKFTEDGGSITFEAAYRPGMDDGQMVARYRVSDTGVGMSEEFVSQIFDEFSQEDNGARTQYKGTGLGMAITKRYVDLMGGTITVESKKGEGSVFTVELPLELIEETMVPKQDIDVPETELAGVRILLAEDNDLNAEIATVQLEELGIRVTRAADGEEAVREFAENPPDTFDLILMDIMMPRMNGYEATGILRALPARADATKIPVIAMTANAFAEDVQASLDAGMNGHIAKPIVMEELIKVIARSLNR